ncbi:MAG: lysoplasmalogenase, partial [Anaerolineaceae bacterium]
MTLLFILCLAFAILDWIAVTLDKKQLEYVAKPATLILLILWFVYRLPSDPPSLGWWFLGGLVLSLAGDIFLMLPGDHFLKGLIAFLFAHICYIIAFNLNGFFLNWTSLLIALVVVAIAVMILQRIVISMRVAGRTALVVPVVIYAFFLGLTLWSATGTLLRPEWPKAAGWLMAIGGTLFFTSDAGIAWNRFVGPHIGGRSLEMITYHLAQITLSAGVLMFIA